MQINRQLDVEVYEDFIDEMKELTRLSNELDDEDKEP